MYEAPMTDDKPKADHRVVTLRMPLSIYRRLAALAERDRRSLNAQALVMLDEAMTVREKEPKP